MTPLVDYWLLGKWGHIMHSNTKIVLHSWYSKLLKSDYEGHPLYSANAMWELRLYQNTPMRIWFNAGNLRKIIFDLNQVFSLKFKFTYMEYPLERTLCVHTVYVILIGYTYGCIWVMLGPGIP